MEFGIAEREFVIQMPFERFEIQFLFFELLPFGLEGGISLVLVLAGCYSEIVSLLLEIVLFFEIDVVVL